MTADPFRYERKFLVDQLDAHQIRALIKRHPAMFVQPYPPRYVNNLYLDTADLQNYQDNVSGADERFKVRIRWYGDLFGPIAQPTLEFKLKRGLVGDKHAYSFGSFTLDKGFGVGDYQAALHAAMQHGDGIPPHLLPYLRRLDVVLCNRYRRWYFATRDGRFRLTVDAELTFYGLARARNRFLHRHVDRRTVIVELKYAKSFDTQAQRIAGFLPFSVTKNSKYATGIELMYG
ncbi:MAG: polyphosphate polymerase domain-containing protein [Anaerolineae bacterium]|nr:polyphosphate polymerase domain-containing protein [Anaerolineae bacterium]